MAWYDITYKCGHTKSVQIMGKREDREKKIAWLEDQICWDCECAKRAEKAKAEAAENDFPKLTGSEKQIRWAEQIRVEKYQSIMEAIDRAEKDWEQLPADDKRKEALRGKFDHSRMAVDYWVSTQTAAKDWIEGRFETKLRDLDRAVMLYDTRSPDADTQVPQISEPAADDTVVCPDNPTEPGTVEIYLEESRVCVSSEKSDKLREIVKGRGFRWDSKDRVWVKTINFATGTAEERGAEIGNLLLNAGFIVKISDESMRKKAIAGDYEPETDRWIHANTEMPGKVIIKIPFGNDDLYLAARKLTGARWASGRGMVVPASSFAEIEDFADTLGYKLSPGAVKEIEKATKEREINVAKRTTVAKKEDVEKPGVKEALAKKLENPGVLDDLRD